MNIYWQFFSELRLRWIVGLQFLLIITAYALIAGVQYLIPPTLLPVESQYFFQSFAGVTGHLAFLCFLGYLCRRKGFSLRHFWKAPLPSQGWYWLFLLFVPLKISAILLNLSIGYFIENFNYLPFQESSEINPLGMWIIEPWKSPWYLAYNLLSGFDLVLMTPIVEEIFFRGFVLHRLSLKYGAYKGLWLSALFFGAFHMHGIGHATLIGLVLGFVYMQTRSLKITICWHILHNALSNIMGILASDPSLVEHPWLENGFNTILLAVFCGFLVFLPTGLRWVRQQPISYAAPLFRDTGAE